MAGRGQGLGKRATYSAINHAEQRVDAPTATESLAAKIPHLIDVLSRETPAEWVGAAAAREGLVGTADAADLRLVLGDGVLPDGKKIRNESVKVTSYGCIIAAPKSVSLLLASSDPAVRDAAVTAQAASTTAWVETMESLVRTRTGAQGKISIKGGGLIGARFDHLSSSCGDPHLHSHLLVSATTPGPKGRYLSLDSKVFHAARRVADAAAMAALHASLSISLGLRADEWEWQTVGSVQTPEIAALLPHTPGVSQATQHIADTLADMGRTLGAETWAEHATAWRKHRAERGALGEKIEHAIDSALFYGGAGADAVRDLWHARAGAGLTPALAAIRAARTADIAVPPARFEEIEVEAREFVEGLHSWIHADVAAWLVPRCGNHRTAYRLAATLMDEWSDQGLITTPGRVGPLVSDFLDGKPLDTELVHRRLGLHARCVSEAQIKTEARLSAAARALAERQGTWLAVPLDPALSAEQASAIVTIAKGAGLTSVTGVAGAGKTSVAAPVAAAARARGMTVISVARNASRAADTGASIDADEAMSVAAFLARPGSLGQRRPVLLVVDESAVIDRADWEQLIEKARSGAVQIVAFGDREQAQSIDRKDSFSIINQACVDAGTAPVLTKSYRNASWENEATALREGRAGPVIHAARREGRIKSGCEADFASDVADLVISKPGAVAVTKTNSDAAAISRAVQQRLGIDATTPIARDSWVGVGDRIRTRLNDHKNKVLNGNRWTVVATAMGGLVVQDEKAKMRCLSAEYVQEAVELDYAATVDSAQGINVPQAIPVLRAGDGRNDTYSGAARGRDAPVYYIITDDIIRPENVLIDAIELDDVARSATEIRARIVEESMIEQQRRHGPYTAPGL